MESEWVALWRRSSDATPFQSPAFVLPWAACFAPGRTGAIVQRHRDRLVALVPWFAWQGALLLAGTGPADYGSDLFSAEGDADMMLAMLAEIADAMGCERIDLQQLRPGSALLRARTPHRWSSDIRLGSACAIARLEGDDGLDAISPRWHKNLIRARERFESETDFEVGLATVDEIALQTAELERLQQMRWRARAEAAVLDDARMRAFVRALIPALAAHGLLRLVRLRVGAETMAVALAMRGARAFYSYLSGFDPAHAKRSPGLVAIGEAMRLAARENLAEFDFMRGREAYKYHLGADDHAMHRRVLTRARR